MKNLKQENKVCAYFYIMVNNNSIIFQGTTMAYEHYESRAAYDYAQSKKVSIGSLTHAAAIAFGVSFVAVTLGAALAGGGKDSAVDPTIPVAPAQCQSYTAYKAC